MQKFSDPLLVLFSRTNLIVSQMQIHRRNWSMPYQF